MKKYLTYLFLLLLIVGCKKECKEPLQIQVAVKEMQRDPALALHLLNNIQPEVRNCNEKTQMKWTLLRIEALDKQDSLLTRYKSDIEQVAKYYEENGTVNEKVKAYYYMGGLYRDSKDPFKALAWYQKAIGLRGKGKIDGHLLSVIYAQMGELMIAMGNMNEALPLMKKSAEYETDKIGKYEAYFLLARAYKSNLRPDSATFFYDKAFNMALKLKNRGLVFNDMIEEQISYFIDTRQDQKVRIRLPYIVKHITQEDEGAANYLYGKISKYIGTQDSAEYYMKKATMFNSITPKACAYRQLMLLKMEQGKWKEAAEYGKSFAELSDTLFQQADADRMLKLHNTFNYESLNQQLTSTTQEARAWEKWLYSAVTFFVLLIAVLIYEYRRKRQQNKQKLFVTYHDMKQMEKETVELKKDLAEQKLRRQEAEQRSQALRNKLDLYRAEGNGKTALELQAEMTELAYKPGEVEKETWDDLEENINALYPHLTVRIRTLCPKINQLELRVVYLSLLDVRPADVARLLSINASNLGRMRKRWYKNITGEELEGDFAELAEKIND